VVPGALRIVALRDPDPAALAQWDETWTAAQRMGVQVRSVEVTSPTDFDAAFEAMLEDRPDALVALASPLVLANRQHFLQFAIRERLPAIGFGRSLSKTVD
jgi:ABC-type uncharacterized transport system substrate-binding protein